LLAFAFQGGTGGADFLSQGRRDGGQRHRLGVRRARSGTGCSARHRQVLARSSRKGPKCHCIGSPPTATRHNTPPSGGGGHG
jgi:hypothetical protein